MSEGRKRACLLAVRGRASRLVERDDSRVASAPLCGPGLATVSLLGGMRPFCGLEPTRSSQFAPTAMPRPAPARLACGPPIGVRVSGRTIRD